MIHRSIKIQRVSSLWLLLLFGCYKKTFISELSLKGHTLFEKDSSIVSKGSLAIYKIDATLGSFKKVKFHLLRVIPNCIQPDGSFDAQVQLDTIMCKGFYVRADTNDVQIILNKFDVLFTPSSSAELSFFNLNFADTLFVR